MVRFRSTLRPLGASALLGCLVCCSALLAQAPAGDATAAAPTPAAAAPQIDPGSTAWMLASSALVLFMTPGLALFYAGMVRSKNVLGTMMHSFFCMGLVTVQWVLIGYTIAFGESSAGGLFGNLRHLFLANVPHDQPFPGYKIPHLLHMAYQMMFAIITPALISGAFAERIKFSAFAVFTLLWTTLVYDPLAHWVWGGGILSTATGSWLSNLVGVGAIDFAGGTVVHISSGVSALVLCLLIGKRRGYPGQAMLPNSLVITVLGAGILWFGWFGFNGGSSLAADSVAVSAFVVTHIAAAAAALSWAAVEWFHRGKASILGLASGLVAGLVCITPASGYVTPMSAILMGLVVSPVCYFMVAIAKAKLGYDDSLDAFGVHGVGGTLGAVLTGIFTNPVVAGAPAAGLKQVLAQSIAAAVTIVYSVIVTLILGIVIDKLIGLRVNEDDEIAGLDLSQHGEVGFNP